MSDSTFLHESIVSNQIYLIRGHRVMLDKDLAKLYGVETKQLKRQVMRNINRFPEDFMFKLAREEFDHLRSHFGTSSWGGIRYMPFAFTEHGIAMLSGILNSDRAIQANIAIIRIFIKMREALLQNREILDKIEKIENSILVHDQEIAAIFETLKRMLNPGLPPAKKVGFRIGENKD